MSDSILARAAPAAFLVVLAGVIWYLGTGRFGRAQSQAWIDRAAHMPRLSAWLNRHHGKLRASAHYVEFGGLFLVLYWCWTAWLSDAAWRWSAPVAGAIGFACAVAAYLDEVHQLQSGTRQFRREDFLHSLCGISLAAAAVFYQALARGG